MHYIYKTKGTCSYKIEFDCENNTVSNVKFTGGCSGNLKALAVMVEGLSPAEIQNKLKGITCGFRKTSCADQLAEAVMEAFNKQ